MSPAAPTTARVRLRIQGTVQGVGFRPHVYRQALRHGVSGWVLNDAEGVLVEAQGPEVEAFVRALQGEAPPLARIRRCDQTTLPPVADEVGFSIHPSAVGAPSRVAPPVDTAVCPSCLADLADPLGRYFGYAFLNCTDCGPRYTLIRALPYDRASTSMAGFAMCPDCAREYGDPPDRRFHAQPTACPACGPRLSMAPAEILERLVRGEIVAIKGIGGFHLACDARQEASVRRLRELKRRDAKPFAVMVADLAAARRVAVVSPEAAGLLTGPERPIVLLPRRDDLAPAVAPELPWLGLMLPYAPLHHLIFRDFAAPTDLALVMTSANFGGEPLVTDNDEARARFGGLVGAIVTHDREIVARCDDSVVRPGPAGTLRVRSGRGHAPYRQAMGRAVPPLLAVGAQLKATACVTRHDEAFVSPHLGDLDHLATEAAFAAAIAHLLAVLSVTPEVVVHDAHPDLASTRFARGFGVRTLAVQHHHAHVGAVMAEHGLHGPVLGLALDGFGLGPRGEAWGGELIQVERGTFAHRGGLLPLAMPGGDVAAREPWRMGAAALHALGRGDEIPTRFRTQAGSEILARMLAQGLQSPLTSSAGRLFDAAAGLLGILPVSRYEGQAATKLEGLVTEPEVDAAGWRMVGRQLDLRPTLERLLDLDAVAGANLFHGTLAAALVEWTARAAREAGLGDVVLAGGCFLNQIVTARVQAGLVKAGLRVYTARELPPGDGGLSLGQAWIAAFQLEDS